MKLFNTIRNSLLATALLGSSLMLQAQTAVWSGPLTGADWNTAGNWTPATVPGLGGSATISTAATVGYGAPMSAASISNLLLTGTATVNVNAAGFKIESGNTAKNVTVGVPNSGTININSGGVFTMTNSGQLMISTNGLVVVNTGGTLLITNTLNSSDAVLVGDNKRLASATSRGRLQVLGGTVTIDKRVTIAGSTTASTVGAGSEIFVDSGILNLLGGGQINNTQDDGACRFLINGGTVGLGNFVMVRSSTAPATGLVISNGVVNATAIQVGTAASRAYAAIYGGVLTNTGIFHVSDTTTAANSGDRKSHFQILGGTVVSTTPEGIIMGYQQNATAAASSVYGGFLELSGGTLFASGITLVKDNTIANAYGTLTMSGTATAFLGSIGLVGNAGAGSSGYFVTLSGGTIGATTDYTNNANMTLSGTITVQAADVAGISHYVYANGIWNGTGGVTKTGNGTLTLDAANIYSGITAINAGTLALGASGSLNNSSQIILASGTKLDASAASGFTIQAGKTLTGLGAVVGDVAFASTASLKPGSNTIAGTLTFSNSITQSGGVDNQFDLSTNPSGPNNDLVVVGGDINLSGANGLTITGGGPANSVHPLFKYSGTFNGSLSSFTVTGPTGYLTNDTSVTPKMIAFVIATTIRGATNVTWVGNGANNVWDTLATTNWLNNGALDLFVSADNALFNSVGQANSNVLINAAVTPASVTVNSTGDYSFTGSGAIGGTGGLTKTNSGTLVISTANTFTGPTTINGGALEIATLAVGDAASPIGKQSVASANLVIDNGSLRYTGGNVSTDRGATLTSSNSTVDVTNSTTSLTVSGTVIGSGTLNKIGAGTLILSGANSYGVTTVSNGTLQVNSVITAIGTGPVNLAGGTLRLNVSSQQTYPNALNVLNNSTLISAGGNNNIIQAPWAGSANLNLDLGSGTFSINANMTTNFTGAITISDSSSGFFRFNAGGNGFGAQQSSGSATASFDLGNSSVTLLNRNGGSNVFGIYDLGSLAGGSSTILKGASNGGSSTNATYYSIGAKNLNATFAGTIQNGSGGAGATTGIIKVGTGVLTLTGNNSYSGYTTVSNGVLALGDGVTDGSIGSSVKVTINAGKVLDVSGRSDGTLQLGGGQTLAGNGIVNGSVNASGTISPGASIGTLTITNIATLSGTLFMELNRTNGVQTNDILAASSIALGGTLTVTNVGPTLHVGDRFVLFNGPITGAFGTVNLPENLGNVTYTWTNKTDIDGSIQVLTVVSVNLTPTNVTTSVSGNTLTLSWPTDHIGWRLQSQTNDLSTGLGSTWTDVDNTSTTNQVNIPLNPANGAVFYRMVYP